MSKRLQTLAAMACMKSFLMIFNFSFWTSGIAILALGVWMEVELYKYMELSTEFSASASYILIGIGCLIIFIGSLACCCTVKGQPTLLYVYGGFLAIVFVLELGAGMSIFAYRDQLTTGFDQGLNQSIADYQTETGPRRADMDILQSTLHCCGNHGYNDWMEMCGKIPTSCCVQAECDTSNASDIYQQGCYDKVIAFLNANINIVAGGAIGIAFFPLLGMVLSCCLANTINKAKYEQMC